jgi:hypothetical protein
MQCVYIVFTTRPRKCQQGKLPKKAQFPNNAGMVPNSADLAHIALVAQFLFLALATAAAADAAHERNQGQKHGNDDAANHDGQEHDHNRFEE